MKREWGRKWEHSGWSCLNSGRRHFFLLSFLPKAIVDLPDYIATLPSQLPHTRTSHSRWSLYYRSNILLSILIHFSAVGSFCCCSSSPFLLFACFVLYDKMNIHVVHCCTRQNRSVYRGDGDIKFCRWEPGRMCQWSSSWKWWCRAIFSDPFLLELRSISPHTFILGLEYRVRKSSISRRR